MPNTVTVNRPAPTPPPITSVTVELTEKQAIQLRYLLGRTGSAVTAAWYNDTGSNPATLDKLGFDRNFGGFSQALCDLWLALDKAEF